jgi:hypothetical protein
MGAGKSSGGGTTTTQLTPEQRQLLSAQTDFLTGTAFPAYRQTVSGAQAALGSATPSAISAGQNLLRQSSRLSSNALGAGQQYIGAGANTLYQLFDPNYEQNQIQAALQAGRESARESIGAQNAMFGGAGMGGSARQALANRNLESLTAQRQATAAAGAQAQVQQNRAAAAQQIMGAGQNLLGTGLQAGQLGITAAQTPLDVYGKYASIVYGLPQQSTTPNFAGTQGQTTTQSSSGKGFKL